MYYRPIRLLVGVLCTLLLVTVSCKKEPKPDGGGGNTGGGENTTDSIKFVPILELDKHGDLLHLPTPFIDFTKGMTEVKEWELKHGSKLLKEKEITLGDKKLWTLLYDTQDPDKMQPSRTYTIQESGKGRIEGAFITLNKGLVFGNNGNVKESFDLMVINDGWQPLTDAEDMKNPMYVKDNIGVAVSLTPEGTQAQLLFMIRPGVIATQALQATLKDFPFVGKYMSDTRWEDIAAHEKQVGVRTLKSETNYRHTYTPTKPGSSNFTLVSYVIKEFTDKNGKTTNANILATSNAFTMDDLKQSKPEVLQWFALNGFNEVTMQDENTYAFSNEYYLGLVTSIKGGEVVLLFTPKDKPAPSVKDPQGPELFPFYDFGESFSPASDTKPEGLIYKKERERGYEMILHADEVDENGNPDYSLYNLSVVNPNNAGLTSRIYYYPAYDTKNESDAYIYDNSAITFNTSLGIKKGDDPRVKKILAENGYVYTGTGTNSSKKSRWYYYNEANKTSLTIYDYGLYLSITIFNSDDNKPENISHPTAALKYRQAQRERQLQSIIANDKHR